MTVLKNIKIRNLAFASIFVTGTFVPAILSATQIYSGSATFSPGSAQQLLSNLNYTPNTIISYSFTGSRGDSSGSVYLFGYSGNTNSSSVTGFRSISVTTTPAVYTGSLTLSQSTSSIYLEAAGSTTSVYTITGLTLTLTSLGASASSVDLAPNAYALRSVYNIQSAALNAGLTYDCAIFDKQGFCLSTGGRYTTTNSPNANSTSGLLIGSYKYDKNIRLGAWIDEHLSTNNANGIKLSNSKPMLGVFGVWSQSDDGLGYEVKVSAGFGEKDLTVVRTSTNEGSSKINTKGIQSVASYGVALNSNWIASPYVGLKYVSINRNGYTEAGSSALTYNTLRQETTSAVAGVKFKGTIDPQTFAVLSAGIEHDLNHNIGQYSAGSSNTTAFNSDVKKTRPSVSAGVYYDIDRTQRLGLNVIHRQEAFQSTTTTSALATYTVSF